MEYFNQINEVLNDFLMNLGIWAPILSCILIFFESLFAFLPLFVFVTVNFLTLGPIMGTIFSWIFTVIGGFTVFYFCKKVLNKWFTKKISNHPKLKKFMGTVSKLKFIQIVLILSIPFTPTFFVNVGAGLSKLSVKKYFYALLIGRLFIVIFCGYIGTSLLECFTNPIVLIKVISLLLGAYIVGTIINKKFDLDGSF